MTKKHFIALADAIKRNDYIAHFSKEHLDVLADFCADMNPRFDEQRWRDYIAGKCGPNGGAR